MLSSRKHKAFVIQAVIGLLLLIGAVLLIRAIHLSLESQGISSGFGFLERTTGWDVGFSLIGYTINDPYWKVILVGVLNTLFLGSIGLICATILGVMVGVLRTSANPVLAFLGTCYVEALRNVPLILQAFFWYAVFTHLPPPKAATEIGGVLILSSRGIFAPGLNLVPGAGLLAGGVLLAGLVLALVFALLPGRSLRMRELLPFLSRGAFLAGVGLALAVLLLGRVPGESLLQFAELKGLNFRGGIRIPPEFAALLVAMSLYGGAFLGEIIRAGFMSVNRGQIEAAQALGLAGWQVFTRVRLPLALRAVLPTLTNQYVWLLKATTLGIAVGFADFFLVISTAINQSGQTLELILILMGGFLVINNLLAAVMNLINRRIALRGTQLRM